MKVLFTVSLDTWRGEGWWGNGYTEEIRGDDLTTEDAKKILKRTMEFLEEQIGAHRGV